MEAQRDSPQVEVTVADAPKTDVGLGRARLDARSRMALGADADGGVDIGDFVEIVGKKSTVAKLFRAVVEDEGKGIIRIDELVRRNAGVSIGASVHVRKAVVHGAERITFVPIISEGHKISFGQGIENFVKRGLLKRPLTQGDVVIVPGIALMDGALPFIIVKTRPEGIVQVVDGTVIEMREEPLREDEAFGQVLPSELVIRFTGQIRAILERYDEGLGKVEGDFGDRVRQALERLEASLKDLEREATEQGSKRS